ncbi:hypothetical protein D3C80_2150710 [compost metagenome]
MAKEDRKVPKLNAVMDKSRVISSTYQKEPTIIMPSTWMQYHAIRMACSRVKIPKPAM